MKPYVICHMVASVDGRTLISRWRPENAERRALFKQLHERLGADAWLVGRVTGQEYAKREAYFGGTDQTYPREAWFARRDAVAYGIVLDPHGKIGWGRRDIGGDPIVVVLTERVTDAHLTGLREDGVYYIFAGTSELDLDLALEVLNRELGIERIEVNGGGITNGAFLRAGLVDEISLAIFPAIDGAKGAPRVFDSRKNHASSAPARMRPAQPLRCAQWSSKPARFSKAVRFGYATASRTGETHCSSVAVDRPSHRDSS